MNPTCQKLNGSLSTKSGRSSRLRARAPSRYSSPSDFSAGASSWPSTPGKSAPRCGATRSCRYLAMNRILGSSPTPSMEEWLARICSASVEPEGIALRLALERRLIAREIAMCLAESKEQTHAIQLGKAGPCEGPLHPFDIGGREAERLQICEPPPPRAECRKNSDG